MRKLSARGFQIVLICAVAMVLSLAWAAQTVFALPPRPDPPPGAGLEPERPVKGGAIELRVDPFVPGTFAVVQWQDGLGAWHDVDGWRGEMEEERVTWYVAPEHFDAGPFRWVVYRGADGEVLATSESFNLPGGHGQVVRVRVLLGR
jgi:hypothetical protein